MVHKIGFDGAGMPPYDEGEEKAEAHMHMEMVPVTAERKAQLDEYARRRGQDTATALDEALAAYLEWERQDFVDAVQSIQEGYEDVRAGRTQPAGEVLAALRKKHGVPR
jgi:predicted transcriptional regulator